MDTEDQAAELSHEDAVAALEKFVIDNDELLELEEQVGRFNIFDALGVVRQEIRHSNFLAWLLDPAESHGQGQLFLKAILMDLLRKVPVENGQLSPIDLDGEDLAGVEVRREWKNIDLLIVANDPSIVITIENKIDAGEKPGALQRYMEIVRAAFPNHRRMFVYLTPQGDEPSDKSWFPYSYGNIHPVLSRCMRRNESVIGSDVFTFIRHYLNVIRGQFMDDPKIDDLCERIYKNHRQAIELISKHRRDPRQSIVTAVASRLRSDDFEWFVEDEWKSISLHFIPKAWLQWLPPIGTQKQGDTRLWIWCFFCVNPDNIVLKMMIGPTTDTETRSQVTDAISSDGSPISLKLPSKKATPIYTQIYGVVIARDWQAIDSQENIVDRAWKSIESLKEHLPTMGEFLKNAITECNKRSESHD